MTDYSLNFSYAYGKPIYTAIFRRSPEDFIVEEILEESLSGEGEHFWLKITKRGENTDWLAGKLANYFSVRKMDVGYGGKKDRHAVTTQWFSIYMPGRAHEIDWRTFIEESKVDAILESSCSHSRKMKKGDHEANRFVVRLHKITADQDVIDRLECVKEQGVPNYFGEQRFGRGGANLSKVARWSSDPRSIRDRNLKGLIISSARSYIFNTVLSARIQDENWLTLLSGDPCSPMISAPLWGRGRSLSTEETLLFEMPLIAPFKQWCDGLEKVGLKQERRALCLKPKEFSWCFQGDTLEITMVLGAGEYATSILREVAGLIQPERDFRDDSRG